MCILDLPEKILSDDLQAVFGYAMCDRTFHDLLLADPAKALANCELTQRDRKAAVAIRGADSLAEYAVRLEQRLARKDATRRVAVSREQTELQHSDRAAS